MRLKIKQYKSEKRIVPRRKSKDVGAVLLFCILLPYVIASLTGNVKIDGKIEEDDELMVIYESDNGVEKIPLETYLVGALAASIPSEFETEAIKAQAVILRTNILRMYQSGNYGIENGIELKNIGQEYLTVSQMKRKWDVDFEQNYERLCRINQQVEGEKLCYKGILITAPYFYASAGSTRNGSEVLGSEDYPYLKGVDCQSDLALRDNKYTFSYTEEEFFNKVDKLFAAPVNREKFWEKLTLESDSAGYVNVVSVGEQQITGEEFRRGLELRSSCLEMNSKNGRIQITTKGLGHGLGMSQCYANQMAQEGADYREILKYFFSDVEFVKE